MDYLFKGLARNKRVRVVGLDATESVSRVCLQQETLPLTTVAFARFLLAGIIIGCLEKENQGITMHINSDGAIKSLFMQASYNGLFRGYVGCNDGDLTLSEENLCIENVIGRNGILSITKTVDSEHNFTSDVILTESNITKDIAYYFFTSEQIPTIIDLQVNLDDDGRVVSAKGCLIQLLTGYEESDVEFLENIKLPKLDDLQSNMSSIFEDFQKLEEIKVNDICDCSKERFLSRLATLPDSDLEELANEDVEVVCHFCKKVYKISKEEIKILRK